MNRLAAFATLTLLVPSLIGCWRQDTRRAGREEPEAMQTASGLVFRSLRDGTGATPAVNDTVRVQYRSLLGDGSELDSSYVRGFPKQLDLGNATACWTEGLQKMKVGGRARLVCPSSIAYGYKGRPGVAGGSTLTFELELLAILPAQASVDPPAARYINVPPGVLAAARLSGTDPVLPPEARARLQGHGPARGMYKVCVAPEGNVTQALVVRGVDGADAAVTAALRQWVYQPRPDGECTMMRFDW